MFMHVCVCTCMHVCMLWFNNESFHKHTHTHTLPPPEDLDHMLFFYCNFFTSSSERFYPCYFSFSPHMLYAFMWAHADWWGVCSVCMCVCVCVYACMCVVNYLLAFFSTSFSLSSCVTKTFLKNHKQTCLNAHTLSLSLTHTHKHTLTRTYAHMTWL